MENRNCPMAKVHLNSHVETGNSIHSFLAPLGSPLNREYGVKNHPESIMSLDLLIIGLVYGKMYRQPPDLMAKKPLVFCRFSQKNPMNSGQNMTRPTFRSAPRLISQGTRSETIAFSLGKVVKDPCCILMAG